MSAMESGFSEAAVEASFEKATTNPGRRYSENFNCADFADEEEMQDVVESFELLHRSIPWLERADVSSESHCGQLKILQAAIDYIIDLEEQLAEHLSGDLYMAAIQSGRAALERSLASVARRPFADVNAGPTSTPQQPPQPPGPQQQQQQPQTLVTQHLQSELPLSSSDLNGLCSSDSGVRHC